jgi:hypothetical protein
MSTLRLVALIDLATTLGISGPPQSPAMKGGTVTVPELIDELQRAGRRFGRAGGLVGRVPREQIRVEPLQVGRG